MRVQGADQTEVTNRRTATEQEVVVREVAIQRGEKVLLEPVLNHIPADISDAKGRQQAAESGANAFAHDASSETRPARKQSAAELVENEREVVVVPAIVHCRYQQPLVAIQFQ